MHLGSNGHLLHWLLPHTTIVVINFPWQMPTMWIRLLNSNSLFFTIDSLVVLVKSSKPTHMTSLFYFVGCAAFAVKDDIIQFSMRMHFGVILHTYWHTYIWLRKDCPTFKFILYHTIYAKVLVFKCMHEVNLHKDVWFFW